METIPIIRIRPVAWRVYVQGEDNADYVRRTLDANHLQTSDVQAEPSLVDPPVESFVVSTSEQVPLTREELEALLERDARIDLQFEP